MSLKRNVAVISMLAACGALQAATVTYTSNTVPVQSANWTDVLSLQQFSPTLGTLSSIEINLFGTVSGTAQGESLDPIAADMDLKIAASIGLFKPAAATPFLVIKPSVITTYAASSYDGGMDYAGTSGTTFSDSATATKAYISALGADLSLFTGAGSVLAPVKATGNSFVTGPGNFRSLTSTSAGAYATVTYTYTAAPVPEASTVAMFIAGLGALPLMARRRRQNAA